MWDGFLSLWSPEWQDFFAYIAGGKHQAFYRSFALIPLVTLVGAIIALVFGFLGAAASRARSWAISGLARLYINMVRGIPDVLFFVFFPLALSLIIKIVRTWALCDAGTPLFDGINFVGCPASSFLSSPNSGVAFAYNLGVACLSFGLVFGAYAAHVIRGALDAVPTAQIETARAFGFRPGQIFWRVQVPLMWGYAWAGLTNIWMLMIKATSLLSLLGIQEAVWWATAQLGPPQLRTFVGYVHGDWTVFYLGLLLVFYFCFTYASEVGFAWGRRRLGAGMVGLGS